MKDYCKIEETKFGTKFYYNENGLWHRLTGPAVEFPDEDEYYYINNIGYMSFYKKFNELVIYTGILKLNLKYEVYIKQSIQNSIQKYNPEIRLWNFDKEEINQLPNCIKDLIIL